MSTCEVVLKNGKTVIVNGRVELFDEENIRVRQDALEDKDDTVHFFNSREVVSISKSCTIISIDGMSVKEVKKALDGINETTPRS